MYGLLPIGKDRHADLLDSIATPDTAAALHPSYERFLVLNDRFKQLCTEWQVRDGEPNDHADEAYDRRCTDDLDELAAFAVGGIKQGDFVIMIRREEMEAQLVDRAKKLAAGENPTGVIPGM